jgi:hypothetical protein
MVIDMSGRQRNVFDRLSMKIAAITAAGLASALAWGQAAPQYKPGESDLVQAIQKETDPGKKVQELKDWAQKFPDSDFKGMRAVMIIQTEGAPVMKAAQTGQGVDGATGQAKDLADNIDNYFSDSNRQPTTTAEQWASIKKSIDLSAHTVLALAASNKKTADGDATAEAEYKKLLEIAPSNGFYAYQLGSLVLREKKVERIPEGLYYIARGVGATGADALPAPTKTAADAYLAKAYEGYHGDTKGLDELKKTAMASVNPPAGFSIKSVTAIAQEQNAAAEQFAKDHPDLALWHQVRDALSAADGQSYFDSSVKDAGLPPGDTFKFFTAKLVEQKSPKELLVNVDNEKGDALLQFTDPLNGTVEVGTEFKFKGSVDGFTKDPYSLTFKDMDKDDVDGLPATLFAEVTKPKPKRAPAKKK